MPIRFGLMADTGKVLPSPADFVRSNLPWLFGLIPVLVAALSIVVTTRGDPQIAGYVLQHVSILPLIISTTLPLIPPVIVWLLIGAYLQRLSMTTEEREASLAIFQPAFMFAVAIPFIFAMQISWLALTSGTLLLLLIGRVAGRRKEKPTTVSPSIIAASVLGAVVCAFLMKSDLWLPTEIITVNKQPPVTAQVIAYDGDWTTYLVPRTGEVQIVRTSEVSSRQPCYMSISLLDKSVWNAIYSARSRHYGTRCL